MRKVDPKSALLDPVRDFNRTGVRRSRGPLLLVALLTVPLGIPVATAQGPEQEPLRPHLPAGSDTNDARAYQDFGKRYLLKFPDLADRAFYWASRLDPAWAEPLYQRATAVIAQHQVDYQEQLVHHWRADSRPKQSEIQRLDSLLYQAMIRDPFTEGTEPVTGWVFHTAPTDVLALGMKALAVGRYAEALSLLSEALRQHPDSILPRMFRAQAYYHLGQYDSTIADLTLTLDSLTAHERQWTVPVYTSKEIVHYAIAIAHVQQGDYAAARASFGRALVENLGLYMAHARLAGVALIEGDTVAALAELDMAVQIEPKSPVLRFYNGFVLMAAGYVDSSASQYRSAIALDPFYAAPYFQLGRLYESAGLLKESAEQYRAFLAHAARNDPDRPTAALRLRTLLEPSRPDSN